MQEIIAALVSFFLLDPLQSEIADRLAAANAPAAVLADVQTCAQSAVPAIVERASSDPLWAVSSAVSVWVGWADPATVLTEAAPACSPAVDAARTYLADGEGEA